MIRRGRPWNLRYDMAARIGFVFPKDFRPANERVEALLAGCAHYGRFDRPLFVAGYNELCRVDLNGRKVLSSAAGSASWPSGWDGLFPKRK